MSAPPSPSIPSTAASSRTTSPTSSTRQQHQQQQSQQQAHPTSRRPNRAALRDYYNLKTSTSPSAQPPPNPSSPLNNNTITTTPTPLTSALDTPSFNPETHITTLLSQHPLSSILLAEASLITEIKGLDGERKALVYDNYSKLITATDTIRRMRRDMGSETEMHMAGRGVLGPAVGHIAATVGSLRERGVRAGAGAGAVGGGDDLGGRRRRRERERETVRWVVEAPVRLGGLVEEGRRGEAEAEWETVRGLLEKWEGVGGVEQVRSKCEKIIEESN